MVGGRPGFARRLFVAPRSACLPHRPRPERVAPPPRAIRQIRPLARWRRRHRRRPRHDGAGCPASAHDRQTARTRPWRVRRTERIRRIPFRCPSRRARRRRTGGRRPGLPRLRETDATAACQAGHPRRTSFLVLPRLPRLQGNAFRRLTARAEACKPSKLSHFESFKTLSNRSNLSNLSSLSAFRGFLNVRHVRDFHNICWAGSPASLAPANAPRKTPASRSRTTRLPPLPLPNLSNLSNISPFPPPIPLEPPCSRPLTPVGHLPASRPATAPLLQSAPLGQPAPIFSNLSNLSNISPFPRAMRTRSHPEKHCKYRKLMAVCHAAFFSCGRVLARGNIHAIRLPFGVVVHIQKERGMDYAWFVGWVST